MNYIEYAPSKRRAGRHTFKDEVRAKTEPTPGWEIAKAMHGQLTGAIDTKEARKQDRRERRQAMRKRA